MSTAPTAKYVETDFECDKYEPQGLDEIDRNSFIYANEIHKSFDDYLPRDILNKEIKNREGIKLTLDKYKKYHYINANQFSSCTKLYD